MHFDCCCCLRYRCHCRCRFQLRRSHGNVLAAGLGLGFLFLLSGPLLAYLAVRSVIGCVRARVRGYASSVMTAAGRAVAASAIETVLEIAIATAIADQADAATRLEPFAAVAVGTHSDRTEYAWTAIELAWFETESEIETDGCGARFGGVESGERIPADWI